MKSIAYPLHKLCLCAAYKQLRSSRVLQREFLVSFLCLLLAACDDTQTYAPVTDMSTFEPIPKSGVHRVAEHETVYEIAWRYGLDYREVAASNQMQQPYAVRPGQTVRVHKPNPIPNLMGAEKNNYTPSWSVVRKWIWPAKGTIIGPYSAQNKGLNIAGYQGQAIYAAAPGKVVYCGDGLRGYGNLIILKHNSLYLSAYAHNKSLLVKEGEWVDAGQKIAEMGNTGSDKVMLHFEIRRAGKPIDPASLY